MLKLFGLRNLNWNQRIFLGLCLALLAVGCGKVGADVVEGRIVFMSRRFELTEHVLGTGGIPFAIEKNGIKRWYDPGSNDGTCLYEKRKVKALYKDFYWPRWSRDGKTVIAVTGKHNENEITLINMESFQLTKVKTPHYIKGPSWFPDNEKIAFISYDEQEKERTSRNIYIYDLKTGEETQMTFFEEIHESMNSVDVSSDGKKIVFDRSPGVGRDGDWWLYLLDIETKAVEKLVKYGAHARWSPDEKKVVYKGNYYEPRKQEERSEILIYDFETNEVKPVTYSETFKMDPCWSPDGKQILFVQAGGGADGYGKSLQVINVDGTNQREVVPPTHDLSDPDWAW